MFATGVNAATYAGSVSGSAVPVSCSARRAATRPMSDAIPVPGAVPSCVAAPGSGTAARARCVQDARARTRAAASASRSSGSSPVAYRRDQRVAQPQHGVLVRQPAADADGVGARGDGEDAAALDAVGRGDGLHLHAVGDDQAVVAELARAAGR